MLWYRRLWGVRLAYYSLAISDSTVLPVPRCSFLLKLPQCAPFLGVHSATLVAVTALALLGSGFLVCSLHASGRCDKMILEWVPILSVRDIPKLCKCNNQKDVTWCRILLKFMRMILSRARYGAHGDLGCNTPYFRSLDFNEYLGFLYHLNI